MKTKESADNLKLINDLIHSLEFKTEEEFQKIVKYTMNPFSVIMSTKGGVFVFVGIDKLSLYEYFKNTYYQMKKEIMDTVTIKDFTKALNKILLQSKIDKAEITNEIIQNMFEEILTQPISNYLIT
jgi:hypothetical protein